MFNTDILDRAIHFAVTAHAGTERRGKAFPYIVHPMEAVSIVATITSDQEMLAAAALHDVVEDTHVTIDDIQAEFGERVARLVHTESDVPGGSWRHRKQGAIDRLAAAPRDAKIVALGDKLSNMRAIARDFAQQGDSLWDLFHAPGGKADHEWHYRGLATSLFPLADTSAYREFAALIDKVFGPADMTQPCRINLDDYEESGGGFCSVSYNHQGGDTMVKFYASDIPIDTSARELLLARHVAEMDIPTPLPGRLVTDGQRYGAEFFRITPKESFARYISNRPDSIDEIAVRFARIVKKLHSTRCDKGYFEPVTDHTHACIDRIGTFTDEEKARMHHFVDNVPQGDSCLHGDLHIGNVITTGGILSNPDDPRPVADLWIDLGDFRWGNPLFDLGMCYFVSYGIPEELTQELYHISCDQMRHVWEIFARDYADCDTPEKLEAFNAQVRPFAALRMVALGTEKGFKPGMEEFIREQLLN